MDLSMFTFLKPKLAEYMQKGNIKSIVLSIDETGEFKHQEYTNNVIEFLTKVKEVTELSKSTITDLQKEVSTFSEERVLLLQDLEDSKIELKGLEARKNKQIEKLKNEIAELTAKKKK